MDIEKKNVLLERIKNILLKSNNITYFIENNEDKIDIDILVINIYENILFLS
jgi:hypothetical protein